MLSVFALISITATIPTQGATGTLAEIEDRGYLIIGSDTTYPPFEEYNATSEQAQGFDIDVAHQMAIALGVELKVVTSEWDPIIPNLKSSQFDVIISAMTITAEREVEVDFTRWYYKSFQAILVEDGNPLGILAETDLNATITIGVQSGTTSDIWVQENLNTSVTLQTFDNILQAIAALKQGSVDVVLGDYAVLAQDELASGETEVVDTYSPEDFGFACRDGDDDLRLALNDAIDGLLGADENNPSPTDLYNTMYYKWFGTHAGDVGYTGTVTDAVIEYVWYEGAAAPGFEFLLVFAIGIIPIIRRKR
jgi:polar amino acid transport system substrate-binding protein